MPDATWRGHSPAVSGHRALLYPAQARAIVRSRGPPPRCWPALSLLLLGTPAREPEVTQRRSKSACVISRALFSWPDPLGTLMAGPGPR